MYTVIGWRREKFHYELLISDEKIEFEEAFKLISNNLRGNIGIAQIN